MSHKNTGLVTVDKYTLDRQGHFTSSNLYDTDYLFHALEHFDGDVLVGSYDDNVLFQSGFFFYDIVADTLEKFVAAKPFASKMDSHALQVNTQKDVVLVGHLSTRLVFLYKYFGSLDGRYVDY